MPKKPKAEPMADTRAREKFGREKELDDLKNILVDVRVREFLWRFMAWCKPFGEPMHQNFGIVGHNLGKRAAAMWLWDEITEADFEALLLMQRHQIQLQIEAENAASQPTNEDESDSS